MPLIQIKPDASYGLVRSPYPALVIVGTLLSSAGSVGAEDSSSSTDQSTMLLGDEGNVSDDSDSPEHRMLKSIVGTPGLTMSEAEKAAAQAQFFANLAVILPLMDACSDDINNVCKQEENPIACLADNVDLLDNCCASQIRSASGNPALPNITFHNDVLLPVGSSLEFDSSCTISKATLSQESHYQSTQLSAGPTFFSQSGDVELTQLVGNTNWLSLKLDDQQPPTRIFHNGTPEYIRLAGQGHYNEFNLSPMQLDIRNSIETIEWKTATLDEVFFFFERSGVSRDPGTTMFHANGKLARGNLANSAMVNGVPLAPGISTFTASGQVLTGTLSGEYEHDELTISKGPVLFNSEGQLISARLAKAQLFGQFMLAADEVTFHENGELKTAFLPAGALLNSNSLPRKARITFDDTGTLQTLAIPYGDPLRSSADGPIFEFGEHRLNPNWGYPVHDTGQLKESRFEDHTVYRGKLYPGYTLMKFDRYGEVIWDSFYDEALQNEHHKKSGRLPEILPISQVRQDVFLPKGSIVYTGGHGKVERAIISRPVRFKDMTLAVDELKFSYRGSGLSLASLHGAQTIDGIRLQGFPEAIMFDQQGRVSYGQLAGDQFISGIWFADKTGINLRPDRTPSHAVLAREMLLDGIALNAGSKVQFHNNGRLKHGQLAFDYTQDGLTFKKESSISLDEEGNIQRGILARDHHILGTTIPINTNIRLSNGKLKFLTLKHAINVQGYSFDGRGIEFRDNGSLRTGVLAIDTNIKGELVVAGTQLLLDSTGQLLGTDFVGAIEPPKTDNDQAVKSSATASVATVMVSRETMPTILLSPPTQPTCDKLFSGEMRSGFSLNGITDTLKQKCQAFYAEYRE